jgi:hypothetical protein
VADVAPEVQHRLDVGGGRPVAEQPHRVARREAAAEDRQERVGLADRHAPRRRVPLGVRQQPAAHEHVHHPHPQRRSPAGGAAVEAARLRHRDPERAGLEEPLAGAAAGVGAGQRQRLGHRVLGVGGQRDRAGEAEHVRAVAAEHRRAVGQPRAIEPRRIVVEIGEQRGQRRRRGRHRGDAGGQRLLEHRPAAPARRRGTASSTTASASGSAS